MSDSSCSRGFGEARRSGFSQKIRVALDMLKRAMRPLPYPGICLISKRGVLSSLRESEPFRKWPIVVGVSRSSGCGEMVRHL